MVKFLKKSYAQKASVEYVLGVTECGCQRSHSAYTLIIVKMKKRFPRNMEERTVTKFLFFPMTLRVGNDGPYEKRWLETSSWTEVYIENPLIQGWRKIHWIY